MISLIAAIQKKDRGLGFNNQLLFRIPDDLKHFKALTLGHPIIMGRKTFESIGKPLPGRTNIIISSHKEYMVTGATIVHSFEEALTQAQQTLGNLNEEIFIIGGGQIYTQALPYADKLYLTLVDSDVPSDTFFPEYESVFKTIISEEKHEDNIPSYSFVDITK